jgi:Cu2+-exporting ATPase
MSISKKLHQTLGKQSKNLRRNGKKPTFARLLSRNEPEPLSHLQKWQKTFSATVAKGQEIYQTIQDDHFMPLLEDARQGSIQFIQDPAAPLRIKRTRRWQTSLVVPTISKQEQQVNHFFKVSAVSFGLAVGAALFFPPLAPLSLIGSLYSAQNVFTRTYETFVKRRKLDPRLLVGIMIVTSIVYNRYVILGVAVFTHMIAEKLVLKVKNESHAKLVNVFRQQPRFVWVLVNGSEMRIPFEQVKQGDTVVVNTGDVIPVDGTIVEGMASIDQHMLTGEAQPAEKGVGEQVFASTVVLSGHIFIAVEQSGEQTTVARIGHILNSTTSFQSNIQLWSEEMALRTVIPTLVLGGLSLPFVGAMGAIALVYAHFGTRMTLVASISILIYFRLMAQAHILVKDGRTLDLLNEIDTVVFDKTGTLTIQQPHVGRIVTWDGISEDNLLAWAAAAEQNQSHPIALAILEEARSRQLELPTTIERAYEIGYGLRVVLEGGVVIQVGSKRFVDKEGLALPPDFSSIEMEAHDQGHSLVLVAYQQQVVGVIELVPTVRTEVQQLMQTLRAHGVTQIAIISGDHEAPTRKLAHDLGVDQYFAETLPQHKADIIEALQQQGRTVCYVGDGINDSIALKKAHVSVSLRGASTAATDTAQIVLLEESLSQLGMMFDFAHDFKKRMHLCFALMVMPTIFGMSGVLFANFGLVHNLILKQIALASSIAGGMYPLVRYRHLGTQESRQANRLLSE